MNIFDKAELIPPDPIFGLVQTFNDDIRPNKVDLMVGVYRDEHLKCKSMDVIRKAISIIAQKNESPNYLPFLGDATYLKLTSQLLFGAHFETYRDRIIAAQGIGGTGALHIAGKFLQTMGCRTMYVPDPTWENHLKIFKYLGFELKTYPYFSIEKGKLLIDELKSTFSLLKEGDVVLLQTSCHNPSGHDPLIEDWKWISEEMKKRGAIALFDTAYQGFKVSLEEDVLPIQYFIQEGNSFLSTLSFSKNFSLYCERISSLFIVLSDPSSYSRVESNIKSIIRGTYSNPPRFGAEVIKTILSDSTLKAEWIVELSHARERIQKMRRELAHALKQAIPERNWESLSLAHGMFSFIGLEPNLVKQLREEYGIYMTGKGRINVSGLNASNLSIVIDAVKQVIEKKNFKCDM
ncbi:MAG: aromatic amino acid transaminase [Simkaniaceae bacterium]|nr:aromatic amino acid transaminase [Simkaniaceae bacterium]